jgi:hypothetical protein
MTCPKGQGELATQRLLVNRLLPSLQLSSHTLGYKIDRPNPHVCALPNALVNDVFVGFELWAIRENSLNCLGSLF